jgi:hypothetical protein
VGRGDSRVERLPLLVAAIGYEALAFRKPVLLLVGDSHVHGG